tara:strand:+ start:37 stop:1845 length:1809 start_codon:yes stop_codon:yes gene_type:complete
LKVVVIGFSAPSIKFLNLLKKLKFIDNVYIASSSKDIDTSIIKINPKEFIQQYWREIDLFIFIGSINIVVRLISPLLVSKDKDPGVIVMDQKGQKIVPLLGIHQTDAYSISSKLANLFDGDLVITNNSKFEKLIKLDYFGRNWGWNRSGLQDSWTNLVINQSNKREIFVRQSSGNKLWMLSEGAKKVNFLSEKDKVIEDDNTLFISTKSNHSKTWHPPVLWIGIGCEKNTPAKFIQDSLKKLLQKHQLSFYSIAGIASVDIKKNESALIDISNSNNWPIKFFKSNDLLKVDIPNPSKIVFDEIGTFSVAEAASLLACGEGGKLLIQKNIFKNNNSNGQSLGAATIAIAESKKQFSPFKGEIHIIGSGPGDLSFLTNDSKAALSECVVWIGYEMYLDLLEPLRRDDQIRINSQLTQEKQRCVEAIGLAEEGIKVALISSGDSGIYGMAGLLLELVQKIDSKFRPLFIIHPGISSLQLAASLAGAPLANDFCAISLSDRLTPWETIERRVHGAMVGDFVVAIFNPQSKERNWQLRKMINICLNFRKKDTPVLIARQVGRAKQNKRLVNLDSIPIDEIDMLTIIIIGNSSTKLVDECLISPRGYI